MRSRNSPFRDENDDSDDEEEYRASEMISMAPPPNERTNNESVDRLIKDKEALRLMKKSATFKLTFFKKKKQEKKENIKQQIVKENPSLHPYQLNKKNTTGSKVDLGNISKKELFSVLKDFFSYFDPVTSMKEIWDIVEWTFVEGFAMLNKKLLKKYGSELVLSEEIVNNTKTTSVKMPSQANQSAKMVKRLTTPGIQPNNRRERRYNEDEERRLRTILQLLEASTTAEEIQHQLLKFYEIQDPERLSMWKAKQCEDFISEILMWTYRFGVEALVINLKQEFIEKGTKKRKKRRKQKEGLSPRRISRQQTEDARWKDPAKVRTALERFFAVYNPDRLNRPLDNMISHIVEKGVKGVNKFLLMRYNEDLSTFSKDKDKFWRAELMQKLFEFFTVHDQEQISAGLHKVIEWTERQPGKEKFLNQYLKKRYGKDLTD